jgi:hypothetical protein
VANAKRLLGVWLIAASCTVLAQSAGEVEFSRGVGFAQAPGQLPRTLGKGLPLQEGDRLTIADGSTAIIKLNDGTRMTLRPNSELVVHQYQYKEGASDNSMIMQLLRGGFRAITGLISKNSPNAARIQTTTATIGIRGTDFDARLCGPECKAESAKVPETARANTAAASAKLVSVQGAIYAIDLSKTKRLLVDGASVYPGETIETGAGAKGVLIFRDDSRMTLGADTQFRVDSFVFDAKNPKEGSFLVSLLRGSLRALTGLIGKTNTHNVSFNTPTATIGIRGTGLDMDCATPESCSFFTWLGTIEVAQTGQTALQTLQAGQGLFVSRTEMKPLTGPTLDKLQRPDTVPVDLKQLFGTTGVTDQDPGLFVFVRDGHIEITSDKETLHLGRGETGYAGSDGQTGRPVNMPLFIQYDKVPMPNSANPMLISVMGEMGRTSNNQCR